MIRPPEDPSRRMCTAQSVSDAASALHSSLLLEEILRQCRGLLSKIFSLGRVSLVQHRTTETTVTIYSLDQTDGPLLGPTVTALEPSRLAQCVRRRRDITVDFSQTPQDCMEREYLAHEDSVSAFFVPVILADRLKGVLVASLSESAGPTAAQTAFLNFVGAQLAIAIENSDAYYLERRRGRQLAMISEIAKEAVMVEGAGEFLSQTSELVREGFDYDVVQIWTISPNMDDLSLAASARRSTRGEICRALTSLVKRCQAENTILCNNDLAGTDAATREGIASQLVVPIRLRDKFLGVLSVESRRLDAFPAEDLNVMEGVASLIASAFDSRRIFENAQLSNNYMQAILESAKDLAVISTDLHGYILTASIGALDMFKLTQQEILGRDLLTLFSDTRFQRELAVHISTRSAATLERNKIPQSVGATPSYLDLTVQGVYDQARKPIGFLCVVRDGTENVLLQKSLEALSVTDELTRLYNTRRFFSALSSELERHKRFHRKLTLCFFDLDGFKEYNDAHGHPKGDLALRETAELLQKSVRSSVDSCYRYGGDEFTIIMPETAVVRARGVIERIRARLEEHFHGQITASIGVAESSETMGASELVEMADRAMYSAKSQGGNRVVEAEPGQGDLKAQSSKQRKG